MSYPPQQQGPYQPQGYPPQQGPAYPPPRPPRKKSKAWLWITLLVVVLVLGGVGFAGFVKPGFIKKQFLDTESRATPEQLAQSFVNAITAGAVLDKQLCKYRSKRSYAITGALTGDATLSSGPRVRSPQEHSATLTVHGRKFGFAMIQKPDGWCVRDIKDDTEPDPLPNTDDQPGPRPSVRNGTEAAGIFVDALNERDIPKALSVVCPDAPDTTADGARQIINGEAKFTVTKTDVLPTARRTRLLLDAQVDGVAGTAQVDTNDDTPIGPCVVSFEPKTNI